MGIPAFAIPAISESWNRQEDWGSVYGRYDIRFVDGRAQLYEFNADTPTSLIEAAYIQWEWLKGQPEWEEEHQYLGKSPLQWNCIFENLVDAYRRSLSRMEEVLGHKPIVHFACSIEDDSGEDAMNLEVHRLACQALGYETEMLLVEDIAFDSEDKRFYDQYGKHLDVVFKLYPWEHICNDSFGEAIFDDMTRVGERNEEGIYTGGTIWIEPPYKMLWSNKGILAVLWELFKDDPEKNQLLIPAYWEDEVPNDLTQWVQKPFLSREGANLTIMLDGEVVEQTTGIYGLEGHVYQAYAPPPMIQTSEGPRHPVLGAWVIDGEPSGLSVRDSEGIITDNLSFLVPHVICN
jgi:glutathionylspermidine synthase